MPDSLFHSTGHRPPRRACVRFLRIVYLAHSPTRRDNHSPLCYCTVITCQPASGSPFLPPASSRAAIRVDGRSSFMDIYRLPRLRRYLLFSRHFCHCYAVVVLTVPFTLTMRAYLRTLPQRNTYGLRRNIPAYSNVCHPPPCDAY